ncbi:hypothetical protein GCM10027289_19200 [Tsukamurella serpentis]
MSTPNDPYGQQPDPNQYPGQQYGGYDPNAQYGAAQYGQTPSYPGQQYPGYPAPPSGEIQDPDNAMGIVGLILAIACCGPIGLVVSWIALKKSKDRGYKNTIALIGTVLGGISSVLIVLIGGFYLVALIIALASADSSSYLMGLI